MNTHVNTAQTIGPATNSALELDAKCISAVADVVGTPFYCYSPEAISQAYEELSGALSTVGASICYAVKANGNLAILQLLARLGCGMDIVSGGEMERALAAGVPASRIIFSGVGKSPNEIAKALAAGVHQINVESPAELHLIADIAASLRLRAPVALRVNPDVDALTHAKISTGKRGDKFGVALADVEALFDVAASRPEIDMVGLAVHIGSQILDLAPYRRAYAVLADLVQTLRAGGHEVPRLDLGGGIGISYGAGTAPQISELAAIIGETVGDLGCELTVEPGRWLVGRAGALVTSVLYTKEAGDRTLAIVDAGMNDLIRPALYGLAHPLHVIRSAGSGDAETYGIVGPVCESSDSFGFYGDLPKLSTGDLLAFGCAGAYSASMASSYNARDLVPEVFVCNGRFRVIRRRQTTAELMALEKETAWQNIAPVRAPENRKGAA
jgi:diaminopimelate decarboxylase